MIGELGGPLFFWVFAFISILFACGVVFSTKVLRAAVYLTVVLISTAAFYLLLGMEFLAGVQVLVYVGGIVVLIIFAVMLTSGVDLVEKRPEMKRIVIGALASLLFFCSSAYVLLNTSFQAAPMVKNTDNEVEMIGKQLLNFTGNGYILPFEIISLLLLSAFVGGIVIARKEQHS